MKISRLIAAIAFSTGLATAPTDMWSQTPDKENTPDVDKKIAVITGHGDILPDGYLIGLYRWDKGPATSIASDTITDGKFRLEVPLDDGLVWGTLYLNNTSFSTYGHRKLYFSPGARIEIEAINKEICTWPVKSEVPEQAEYESFLNSIMDILMEQKKAAQISEERYDSLSTLLTQRKMETLKTIPVGSVWFNEAKSIALMSRYKKPLLEEMKTIYSGLDDADKNSQDGRTIYNYLYPGAPLALGDEITDTEFHDLEGNVHRFSELKGKWCVVDFWIGGCSPCLAAMPEIRQLEAKYTDSLAFVSLSLDKDEAWKNVSQKLPPVDNNWNEGKEQGGLFTRLGLKAYPTFMVISPEGRIHDIWSGYSTGSLKRRVDFNLKPKAKPAYSDENGIRSVAFPEYEANKTDRIFDIERIEISDKETRVYFSFVYLPGNGISISPDAYLSDSSGSRYKVIGSEGIVMGEPLLADKDGYGSFSISFEKIPAEVSVISFHEGLSDRGASIEGIALKP